MPFIVTILLQNIGGSGARDSGCSCIEKQGDSVSGACGGGYSGLKRGDIDFPIGPHLAYSIVALTFLCHDVVSIERRRGRAIVPLMLR